MQRILGHALERLQIGLQIAVAGIARNPDHRNTGNPVTRRHNRVNQPIGRRTNKKVVDNETISTLDNLNRMNVRASLTKRRGDRTQRPRAVPQRNPQQIHTMIIAYPNQVLGQSHRARTTRADCYEG